jgi:SAM-dependent methyltransferase
MNEAEYFKDRGMNEWHYLQVNIWIDYFKPVRILDVGCGLGNLVNAFNYMGRDAFGCDISIFAVDHAHEEIRNRIRVGDVKKVPFGDKFADLVICYDVLEHLNEDEVESAINELKRTSSKWILCSICMAGDKNFPLDPTHKLYKSRAWWEHQFKIRGMKIHTVPNDFLFKNQLVIAEVIQ